MSKLENKVAIVTGASKGIGAGIAKAFAKEGAKVVVNYASSKDEAEKVVKAITKNGGTAIAVQGDVSKETDVKRLFEETKNTFGSFDILVNNAAYQGYTPIEQITAESFHQHFNVNVLGAILAIQSSLKLFSNKGGSYHQYQFGRKQNATSDSFVVFFNKSSIRCHNHCFIKRIGHKKYSYQFYFAGCYGN